MADDLCEDEWWIQQDQVDSDKKNAKKRKSDNLRELHSNPQEPRSKSKRKAKPKKDKCVTTRIDENTLWAFFKKENEGILSNIELEDLQPGDGQFLPFDSHPVSLSDLSTYLQKNIPEWEDDMSCLKDSDKGCPLLLVITASARRSVDVLRAMQDWKTPKCKAAKLFAKHFKLEDQQTFLEKSKIHLAIGTPNRIGKLKSDGFLKFKRLQYVIIDWSYEDAKKRKLVDIPEMKRDFLELLQKEILFRLKQKKLKYIML